MLVAFKRVKGEPFYTFASTAKCFTWEKLPEVKVSEKKKQKTL